MKKISLPGLFICAVILSCFICGCSGTQYNRSNGNKLITADFLCKQIKYLASDSMKGRNTPSPQLDSAASYIAGNFRDWGIKPWNGSYFQEVPICVDQLGDSNELAVVKNGASFELTIKSDYVPYDFSSAASVTAPVVFAGYGITAPEFNYDDYKGIDAKGRIVVIFRNEPQKDDSNSVFNGKEDSKYISLKDKMKNAITHGATGMLIVNGPLQYSSVKARGYPWPSLSKVIPKDAVPLHLCMDNEDLIPAMHIGEEMVRMLFGSIDSLKNLQARIEKDLSCVSFELPGIKVSMHANIRTTVLNAKNVVGFIEGSDPVLNKQLVIIGAHYDHVGYKKEHKADEDYIFNGADDNASGTSGVMSVAYAFSQLKKKPKRSMMFILFAGEEKGLFGSRYYTTHPLHPLASTVAMLNLDMISRNSPDSLYLEGAKQSPDITEIIKNENKKTKFKLVVKNSDFLGGSDHYYFYKHNVPFIFYFTGLHKDYHQVSDNPDKSDCNKAARVSRLVFYTAGKISNENIRYSINPVEGDAPVGQ
ncbi:MAG: M20/M25/M40 family metallo-hydrolase [Bacteroidetes bacterium]|nr:M20/M25/M40 family metallo-hydrolase [Bacteroidota bacterium]